MHIDTIHFSLKCWKWNTETQMYQELISDAASAPASQMTYQVKEWNIFHALPWHREGQKAVGVVLSPLLSFYPSFCGGVDPDFHQCKKNHSRASQILHSCKSTGLICIRWESLLKPLEIKCEVQGEEDMLPVSWTLLLVIPAAPKMTHVSLLTTGIMVHPPWAMATSDPDRRSISAGKNQQWWQICQEKQAVLIRRWAGVIKAGLSLP